MLAACSSGSSVRRMDVPPEIIETVESPEEISEDPDMLLALAEYNFSRKRYDESLQYVQRVLVGTAETLQTDHAFFLKGMIYASVLNFHQDIDQAAAAFRMVISSPPESDFDKMAEEQLKRLKKQ